MSAAEQHVFDAWMPRYRGHDSFTSVSTPTSGSIYLADPPSAGSTDNSTNPYSNNLPESLAAMHLQVQQQFNRARHEFEKLTRRSASGAGSEWLLTKVITSKSAVRSWVSKATAQREAIGKRLQDLIDAAADEHPEIDVPNQVVLDSVFRFFEAEHGLVRPKLTLTPRGGVWAQWRQGVDHAVALHFKADGVNLIASVPRPGALFRAASFADSGNWQLALRRLRDDPLFSWTHAPAGG